MHKKLESELISIAHSVLQMKNKNDVVALKNKAQDLYERLSVLAFIDEYIENQRTEILDYKMKTKSAFIHYANDIDSLGEKYLTIFESTLGRQLKLDVLQSSEDKDDMSPPEPNFKFDIPRSELESTKEYETVEGKTRQVDQELTVWQKVKKFFGATVKVLRIPVKDPDTKKEYDAIKMNPKEIYIDLKKSLKDQISLLKKNQKIQYEEAAKKYSNKSLDAFDKFVAEKKADLIEIEQNLNQSEKMLKYSKQMQSDLRNLLKGVISAKSK